MNANVSNKMMANTSKPYFLCELSIHKATNTHIHIMHDKNSPFPIPTKVQSTPTHSECEECIKKVWDNQIHWENKTCFNIIKVDLIYKISLYYFHFQLWGGKSYIIHSKSVHKTLGVYTKCQITCSMLQAQHKSASDNQPIHNYRI